MRFIVEVSGWPLYLVVCRWLGTRRVASGICAFIVCHSRPFSVARCSGLAGRGNSHDGECVRSRFVAIAIRGTCVNYFALGVVSSILWVGTENIAIFLNWRLAFFGYISYGLYLVHMLFFDLHNGFAARFVPFLSVGDSFAKCCLRLLITLTLATALAYLSRTTYEEFFLRMKDRRKPRAASLPDIVPSAVEG